MNQLLMFGLCVVVCFVGGSTFVRDAEAHGVVINGVIKGDRCCLPGGGSCGGDLVFRPIGEFCTCTTWDGTSFAGQICM